MDLAVAELNRVVELFSEGVRNGENTQIGTEGKPDSEAKGLILIIVWSSVFVQGLIEKSEDMRVSIEQESILENKHGHRRGG